MKKTDPLAEIKQTKGYWRYALRAKIRLKLSVFFWKLYKRFDN